MSKHDPRRPFLVRPPMRALTWASISLLAMAAPPAWAQPVAPAGLPLNGGTLRGPLTVPQVTVTGAINVPTVVTTDNSTLAATTAWVRGVLSSAQITAGALGGNSTINISGLADFNGIAAFWGRYSFRSLSSTFEAQVLALLTNLNGGGEADVLMPGGSIGGMQFFATSLGGLLTPQTPVVTISPTGALSTTGGLSTTGPASFGANFSNPPYGTGSSGGGGGNYPGAGAIFGWNVNYGKGDTDLLLGQNGGSTGGLNVYAVAPSGFLVPTTPILALTKTGDLTTTGHQVSTGTAPSASAGAVVGGSTDARGAVAFTGTVLTTTVTFAAAYGGAPFCVASANATGSVAAVTATSTTTLSLALSANAGGVTATYHCIQ